MDTEWIPSRRDVLRGAFAVIAAEAVNVGVSRAETPSLAQLSNMGAETPQFVNLLAQHFPGFVAEATTAALLPHTRVFQNTTGQHLRALSITWQIPHADGGSRELVTHYLAKSKRNLSMQKTCRGEGRMLAGRRTIIRAGDYFLVTPLFLCSALAYKKLVAAGKTGQSLESGALAKKKRVSRLLAKAPTGRASTATVSALIYPHGQLQSQTTPATQANLLRRFEGRREAELKEAAHLLTLLQSGGPKTEVRAAVEARAGRALAASTRENPHVYDKVARRYARHVLRFMKKHGLKHTVKLLEAVQAVKPLRVSKIA